MDKNSKNRDLPDVTFAMISFNDEKILADCLASIRGQKYPQEKVRIELYDGGSSDNTSKLAKTYDVNFNFFPDLEHKSDVRAGMAITSSKTELTCFFSADNRFTSDTTLSDMVAAINFDNILGVSSLRFAPIPSDSMLSRYFALVGGTDPAVLALGLNDRLAYDQKVWAVPGLTKTRDGVIFVKFDNEQHHFPTLGANGFLFKTSVYKNSPLAKNGFHIDMCLEASRQNSIGKFAFLMRHNIHHKTGPSLRSILKRRMMFASLYDPSANSRIYSVLNKKSALPLACFVASALVLVPALLRAIRAYWLKKDIAWFLHPLVSFCFAACYCLLLLKFAVQKLKLQFSKMTKL